jgi:hypothetical protein
MGEPRDWRAIERWLRDIEKRWREGDLGSIEPGAWKKFDTRLKDALAPLREALSQAREQAKAARQSLIDDAVALAAKAMDRDAPSQISLVVTGKLRGFSTERLLRMLARLGRFRAFVFKGQDRKVSDGR